MLAGCGGAKHAYASTEPVKITQIVLEGGNGKVTVHTSARDDTAVSRATSKSRDPGKNYTVEGTVLHVKTDCGFHCSQDFDIQAPAGVAVSGGIASNDLTLDGIATADVSVSSGNVTVAGATGQVRVKTDSGTVTVGLAAAAPVTATSGSGNVTVTVPAGRYQVKTRSGSGGKIKSAVANTAGVADTLDLETGSGNLTIKTA